MREASLFPKGRLPQSKKASPFGLVPWEEAAPNTKQNKPLLHLACASVMRPPALPSPLEGGVDSWPTLELWYGDLSSSHKTFIDTTCKPIYLAASKEALERDYQRLHLYSFVVWRYQHIQESYHLSNSPLRRHPRRQPEGDRCSTCWPACAIPLAGRFPQCSALYNLIGGQPRLFSTKTLLLAMRTCIRDTYAFKYKASIDSINNHDIVSLLRQPLSERETICR